MAKIRPINEKVLVKRLEAETKTKGGIVLPDTAKEKPKEGDLVTVHLAVTSADLLAVAENEAFERGGDPAEALRRYDALAMRLASERVADIADLGEMWLAAARRPSEGAVLVGTLEDSRAAGPWRCGRLSVRGSGPRAIVFFTRTLEGVDSGDDVIVTGVLGDSHAALFAHAGWRPGVVKATYGTGSSLMSLADSAAPDVASLCRTIAWRLPGEDAAIAYEANILSAGSTLVWLAGVLGTTVADLVALDAVGLAVHLGAEDVALLGPEFPGVLPLQMRRLGQQEEFVGERAVELLEEPQLSAQTQEREQVHRLLRADGVRVGEDAVGAADVVEDRLGFLL